MVREILVLEKRLRGNVVTPLPSVQVSPEKLHPIFATESQTENTASTSKDFLKDLNHNDENESLPSPSIQSTGKGSSYDWGESQDIIPATQFHHASPEDIIPETQIDEDSQDKARNGTDRAASETIWDTGREEKPEKMDVDSGNECRAISKGEGGDSEEQNGADNRGDRVNGSPNGDNSSIKSDSPTDEEDKGKGDGKGKIRLLQTVDPESDDGNAETKKVSLKRPLSKEKTEPQKRTQF